MLVGVLYGSLHGEVVQVTVTFKSRVGFVDDELPTEKGTCAKTRPGTSPVFPSFKIETAGCTPLFLAVYAPTVERPGNWSISTRSVPPHQDHLDLIFDNLKVPVSVFDIED